MDVEQRTRICRLIEAVISADGFVKLEEREFLRRVVRRFEIAYEMVEVGHVDENAPVSDPGRAAALLRELDPSVQARVMALLVDSAVTDGVVHPKEHALLLVAAAALNVDATALEERIAQRLARATGDSGA
jgi:uncharacterized tellurite resistance protein B-like protein